MDKLSGKKILIWGYGREGRSTESFIKSHCPGAVISVFEGKRDGFDIDDYDYVIKSPGIPCFEEDARLTSQTQLFLEVYRDKVCGVTGTKGKSTTASMLAHVLEDCGRKALLVGNIGLPCLDYFDEAGEAETVVFELSCHQLSTVRVSPAVAVILNLFEEHLDYYGSADKYYDAKRNIAKFQRSGDHLIKGDNVGEAETPADTVVIAMDGDYDIPLKLAGRHNLYNARVAEYIACKIYGCDEGSVKASLADFEGLAHRMEFVGEYDGISYYDDSISTIPEAAICAAQSIKGAQTLLIGGMDRGINYDKLTAFMREHDEYIYICMYESGKRVADEARLSGNLVHVVDELSQAVTLAKQLTDKGRACILTPAAASYGYFKNFEERGDEFQRLVRNF